MLHRQLTGVPRDRSAFFSGSKDGCQFHGHLVDTSALAYCRLSGRAMPNVAVQGAETAATPLLRLPCNGLLCPERCG
jgi:hypothetical protein